MYVNTQGDPYVTASGHRLTEEDVNKVIACPPPYKLGTKFWTEHHGILTCEDRGGAIKGKRIDLWTGIGQDGHDRVSTQGNGYYEVFIIN
jgi:3D (Asp-Asp-Asp) domain-containing protein